MSAPRLHLTIIEGKVEDLDLAPGSDLDHFQLRFRYPPAFVWSRLFTFPTAEQTLTTLRQLQQLPPGTEIHLGAVGGGGESPWTTIERVA